MQQAAELTDAAAAQQGKRINPLNGFGQSG
jgi:hypothetical protein